MPTTAMTLDEIHDLARAAFLNNGCDEENASALVETVVDAERDGSHSHGLFRVPGYVDALRSGKVNGKASPTVVRKTPAIVQVDGDNGFAPLALRRGVPELVLAARAIGVAVMPIVRTHHFAALWPETEAIAQEGLVGMACVCYTPCMAPSGGATPLFGTNPISFAWPRPGTFPMVFDMATAAMARGDIQIAARDGRSVPAGTGLDAAGNPTTDPDAILKGMLLPFGGYKGSALALMVELLAAGATGEHFSYEAAKEVEGEGDIPRGGEFLLALSPELLAGPDWVAHCEKFFRAFEAIEGARLPGARRHSNRMSVEARQIDTGLLEKIRSLV